MRFHHFSTSTGGEDGVWVNLDLVEIVFPVLGTKKVTLVTGNRSTEVDAKEFEQDVLLHQNAMPGLMKIPVRRSPSRTKIIDDIISYLKPGIIHCTFIGQALSSKKNEELYVRFFFYDSESDSLMMEIKTGSRKKDVREVPADNLSTDSLSFVLEIIRERWKI